MLLLCLLLAADPSGEADPPPAAAAALEFEAAALADEIAADHPDWPLVVGLSDGERTAIVARGGRRPHDPHPDAGLDGDTLFEIGSVTKTLTGLLLADAIGRGEVSERTTVGEVRPELTLSDEVAAIRLVDLAQHQAGLPRIADGTMPQMLGKMIAADQLKRLPIPGLAAWTDRTLKPNQPYAGQTRETLDGFLRDLELSEDRGFAYSNLGVAILTDCLCRRADRDYADLVADRVLTPLGLDDTFVIVPESERPRLIAGTMKGLPMPHWERSATLDGVGGLKASARDLLAYGRAMIDPPEPLRDAVLRATKPTRRAGAKLSIGYGWMLPETTPDGPKPRDRIRPSEQSGWHNGSTFGASSEIAFDRATGRVAVLLIAAGDAPTGSVQRLLKPLAAE